MEVLQGLTVASWFSETHGDLNRMIRSVMGLLLFLCKGRKEEHGQRNGMHPPLPVKHLFISSQGRREAWRAREELGGLAGPAWH